jgi:hypothetical protein
MPAQRNARRFLAILLTLLPAAAPLVAQSPSTRLSRCGVVRAQAVVDSVFLDRTAGAGTIMGGDWASYLMARLGAPLPDTTAIGVQVDSEHITMSGRIKDLPPEARATLGMLAALADSNTMLNADVVLLPANKGLAHFQLRSVSIGPYPVPEVMLRSMLLDVGERYPALTRSGRDLYVQIPTDGRVTLVSGAVRLEAPRREGSMDSPPPAAKAEPCRVNP